MQQAGVAFFVKSLVMYFLLFGLAHSISLSASASMDYTRNGKTKNNTKMKSITYYIALVALFIVCMVGMAFLMAGVEQVFNLRLGGILMNFGFLVGIGAFFAIKPFVKKKLKQ